MADSEVELWFWAVTSPSLLVAIFLRCGYNLSTLSVYPLNLPTRDNSGISVPEFRAPEMRTQQTSLEVWYTAVSRSGISFSNRTMITECTRRLGGCALRTARFRCLKWWVHEIQNNATSHLNQTRKWGISRNIQLFGEDVTSCRLIST